MSNTYKDEAKNHKAEAKRIMNSEQMLKCNAAIHTAAVACGKAGAIPIPVADAIPISGFQITMAITLGKVFDQKITESAAKGIIGATAASFVGRNLVKFIPVIGWVASAYVAAGITEAIGWKLAVDFAKQAKKEWMKEHNSDNEDDSTSESKSKESEIDVIISSLQERANPFLNHEKTVSSNKSEYDILIADFEKVLDYIDENNKLRKSYDDLCNLD